VDDIPRATLNAEEAAFYLGVGYSTFRMPGGIMHQLPYLLVGNGNRQRKRFRVKDLDAYLAKQVRKPSRTRAS
jgi:hypothetical protein